MIGILAVDADQYGRLLADLHPVLFSEAEELVREAPDVAVLLAAPDLAAEVIGRLPKLRWLQSTWAGVDALTRPGLRRDYVLTKVHRGFGPQMVEYVFAYLLAHERRLFERFEAQRARHWDPLPSGTLAGKTLGILGTGDIGTEIAEMAHRFGMRTAGCNRSGWGPPVFDEMFPSTALTAFGVGVDHLVVVLPSTSETERLVGEELVEALPVDAVLINVGRGSTVDLGVVVAAVADRRLAGAVIDVTDPEPLPSDHPAWSTPGVLLTAHTAAVSRPADIAALFRSNLTRYRARVALEGVVEFERGY